jgi:hypothetical protein
LEAARKKRLKEENLNRVLNLYREYKQQIPSSEWIQCPPEERLERYPEFEGLFNPSENQESSQNEDGLSSSSAAATTHEQFASAVANWRKNRKQYFHYNYASAI